MPRKAPPSPQAQLAAAQRAARREGLELRMLLALRAAKLVDGMTREHRFHPTRAWRFDFAWPAARLALEVEGGTRSGGRHTTGTGFEADAQKYNEAALLGWTVLRVTGAQVRSGAALQWCQQALQTRKNS